MGVLGVAGLGAVVVVTFARGSRTGSPLRLAQRSIAIGMDWLEGRAGKGNPGGGARLHAICSKGIGYGFLRHDGSIDGGTGGSGDDLRAQGTRGGRVDKAGVPRVLDAVHDGGIAIVGVRARGLAFERGQGAVGARTATCALYGGRL